MAGKGSKGASRGPQGVVKTYLIAYNAASAVAWLLVLTGLLRHVTHFTTIDKLSTLFAKSRDLALLRSRAETTFLEIGKLTKWVQTGALLEIVHALLGFVRSSVPTTAAQVASRLFLVWYVCHRYPGVAGSPFYSTMVLAWSVTEVIRYSHYVLNLVGAKLAPLEYLRYTTFYALYPLGAGSEAALVYLAAPYAKREFGPAGEYAMYGLTLLWPPALFVMMSHMHAQRRKHLSGSSSGPAIKTPKPVREKAEQVADEAKSTARSIKKKTSTMQLRERASGTGDEAASDLSDTPAKSTRSKKAVR